VNDSTFASLGLAPELVRGIEALGHHTPTAIQRTAIRPILAGRDVRARAQTGSGKTGAFGLPMLQRLLSHVEWPRKLQGLILVPTRELAVQIANALRDYAAFFPRTVKINAVFGGVSINPQMMELRGNADIVVATPGRLLDLVRHNAVLLGTVSTLVLDEADRMLDLGFADELSQVLELLPPQRQSLMFSATFPAELQGLCDTLLRSPIELDIESEDTGTPDVLQRSIVVDASKRTQLLRHLVETNDWSRVLVFVATQYATEHVAQKLRRWGINAAAFHGDLSQGARTDVLAKFKSSQLQVLVATDVAARGLDIIQLAAVVNYDLPRSAADYIHRIGRTARAGESGTAVSFVSAATESHFRLIENRYNLRLEREQLPGFEPTQEAAPSLTTGGVKGKRKSKKDKLRENAKLGR
jgi:ATP-dependent RNA helicase RhlE